MATSVTAHVAGQWDLATFNKPLPAQPSLLWPAADLSAWPADPVTACPGDGSALGKLRLAGVWLVVTSSAWDGAEEPLSALSCPVGCSQTQFWALLAKRRCCWLGALGKALYLLT